MNLLETIAMPSKKWGPRPQNYGYSHSEYETISKALIRDNSLCLVTGRCDFRSMCKDIKLEKDVMEGRLQLGSTRCAHIFPALTNDNISGSDEAGAEVYLTFPLPSPPLIVHAFGTSMLRPFGLS